tara:strand:+ start:617 stop:775 length:159 start_codon:yes stop_codon:yes gene_type:complete
MGRIYILLIYYTFGYDIMICLYCKIEKEELYMGGGSYAYKCPRCGDKTEVKK